MNSFILKIMIWFVFLFSKEKLPTKSKISNPKMRYEIMSGAFIWEDEGLWELRNSKLIQAFRYVINHRMKLLVGPENDVGCFRSLDFDKQIYKIAKRFYPNWIGFEESRCSFNPEIADKIMRIKKVAKVKMERFFNEH
ncbi:hypothetical protein [Flavobacterium sp. J27]|uniref:hypothetical protein n=1 Tax=Flavobacterium sp. J27 TaxID=2060419 RepID=UPI00103275AF|nr:hypothetical protein [Flavobacterium sp. J27]